MRRSPFPRGCHGPHLSSKALVGTVPFGFRSAVDGIHVEESPEEQEILSRVRELRDIGYTLREIADELNRQGYRTRRGSPWRHQYVAAVVPSLFLSCEGPVA